MNPDVTEGRFIVTNDFVNKGLNRLRAKITREVFYLRYLGTFCEVAILPSQAPASLIPSSPKSITTSGVI